MSDQEHKTRRTFIGPLTSEETIDVFSKDNSLYTNVFGEVYPWRRRDQDAHLPANSRICTHRLKPMPATQLFGDEWLRQLSPQLSITGWAPVWGALNNGVVTLGFDMVGPVEDCINIPGALPENHWNYKLYPVRVEGIATEHVLLGVLT